MIDFRHETFLQLCRVRSYTKAAECLHITQPAVSQHIRQLEALYGGRLVEYKDKRLSLTPKGRRLCAYVQTLWADSTRVRQELQGMDAAMPSLVFGATLTIGEYVMPRILRELLKERPLGGVSMVVENTKSLLQKLREGVIDFALLEGFFDQSQYEARPLGYEEFIPVCSPRSPLAGRTAGFEEAARQRLIIREPGSGTREIFEQAMRAHNYSVNSFSHVVEIGNMSAIKQLVAQDAGVSFMYLQAARRELEQGELSRFHIPGFSPGHEFSFVFLKNSLYQGQYLDWFDKIRAIYPAALPVGGPDGETAEISLLHGGE